MGRALKFVLIGFLAGLVFWSKTSQAQSSAGAMALSAEEKFRNGDAKGAISIYEGILSKPTSFEGIWTVRYNLGVAYYTTEAYDKALPLFEGLAAEKNVDPQLKEQALWLVGGTLAAKAGMLPKNAARNETLEQSIRVHDDFLKRYPKSKLVDEVLYGKAAAQLSFGRLDEAEKTVRMIGGDGDTNLKNEATYLLARIDVAQAKKLLGEKKETEGKIRIAYAKKLFDELSKNQEDLILANEANFSAGDALVNMGNYSETIAYLRKVKSKQALEEIQGRRLQDLRNARNQALRSGNQQLQDELSRQYNRAYVKFNAIRKGAPLFLNAQELISKGYYEQKKYDEVLILNRHFLPHFDSEQKQRARYIIIKALLGKNAVDKAIQEYTEFKSQFPKDKIGEDIPISLADYFLRANKYNEAIRWADEYEMTYPEGAYLEQAYFLASVAASSSGNLDDAQKRHQKFQKKFPGSSLMGVALFNKAYANYLKKNYDAATPDLQSYIRDFPNAENTENATLFIGISLFELKKYNEAIKELQKFEKKYPKSKFLCNALYQMGRAYDEKKDLTRANTIYTRVVKDCPQGEVAPFAQFGIALNLLSLGPKQHPQVIAAFDQFLNQFPTHPMVPKVYLYKAEIYRADGKLKDVQTIYEELMRKYPESGSAAEAQVAIGEMFFQEATHMAAKPNKLPTEKQGVWKDAVQKSQKAYEQVFKKYPNHPAIDKALSQMSLLWQTRINAQFTTLEDAKSYFDYLSFSSDPALKIKIAFTLGSLLYKLDDRDTALKIFEGAFEKVGNISLPDEGYKQYRNLLIANKQYSQATALSERQLKEKHVVHDDRGIAEATFGLGRIFFEKGEFIKAARFLRDVVEQYPWHETTAPEAEFYLAWIEEKKQNFDEAIKGYKILLPKVLDPILKVSIFVRLGYAWCGKSEGSTIDRAENLKQAIAYFLKVGTTYGAYPTYAAEGLYMGAFLYEKLAAAVADSQTKTPAIQNATTFYKRCIQEYPHSPWAEKSRERLKAMGILQVSHLF